MGLSTRYRRITFSLHQSGHVGAKGEAVLGLPAFVAIVPSFPIEMEFSAYAIFTAPSMQAVNFTYGVAPLDGPYVIPSTMTSAAVSSSAAAPSLYVCKLLHKVRGIYVGGAGALEVVLVVEGEEVARAPLFVSGPGPVRPYSEFIVVDPPKK